MIRLRSPRCLIPKPQELAGVAVWIETPESFLFHQPIRQLYEQVLSFVSGEEQRLKPEVFLFIPPVLLLDPARRARGTC